MSPSKRKTTSTKAKARKGTKKTATKKPSPARVAKKTQSATQRRTESGGYIRMRCPVDFHARVQTAASKAGKSVVLFCQETVSAFVKSPPKTLAQTIDAPKGEKPYPPRIDVETSPTLHTKIVKLAAKYGVPAHVVVRESVKDVIKGVRATATPAKPNALQRAAMREAGKAKKKTARAKTAKKKTGRSAARKTAKK